MKTTCMRIVEFDAGHRVYGHEGKCRNPHGHRYRVELHAVADALDEIGRVIDFSVLKERVGGWIDHSWDHGFLVWEKDHSLLEAITPLGKVFEMPDNPTAENIAAYLLNVLCPHVLRPTETAVRVIKVVVWETPNCCAEASL